MNAPTKHEPLVLYVDEQLISPWAFTAFVALEEKKLTYALETVALGEGTRAPAHLARSLTGLVPVLEHGAFALSESLAIAEYLAETFPFPAHPRLFPADLRERGRARQVMLWLRTELLALREDWPSRTIFYGTEGKSLTPAGAGAAAELVRVADAVVRDGASSLFEAFCIADADLAFFLQRLLANGYPLAPKLEGYARAVWQRPSVQRWVAHERPGAPKP